MLYCRVLKALIIRASFPVPFYQGLWCEVLHDGVFPDAQV